MDIVLGGRGCEARRRRRNKENVDGHSNGTIVKAKLNIFWMVFFEPKDNRTL